MAATPFSSFIVLHLACAPLFLSFGRVLVLNNCASSISRGKILCAGCRRGMQGTVQAAAGTRLLGR